MSARFRLVSFKSVITRRVILVAALSAACAAFPALAQDSPREPDEPRPSQEEPIVADDEFLEAIPDLTSDDPELGEELETIEAFERRFETAPSESAEAPSTGVSPAPPEPAPAPNDTLAASWDKELAAPLPPLEDLVLTESAANEASGAPSKARDRLRYSWSLAGLEAAGPGEAKALRDRFKTFSTLEKGDGKAANVAMLFARLADDAALLERLLKAEGWYLASVEPRVERAGEADEAGDAVAAVATLDVEPGPRFTFGAIKVDAPDTVPANLIANTLTLIPGDPIIAAKVLANEALIAKRLPENGYPFAQLGRRDILLDAQTGQGDYTLPVEIGPRARIGQFAVSGEAVFDPEHIAEIARIAPGDLYDSRYIDDLRRALAATGLLRSFSVEPQRTGEPNEDGTEAITVLVDQTRGPARTLAGTAGFGTGQGFRIEGSWAHRNLFPPEGALTASLIAGTREQGASLSFRRANAGKRDRAFEIGASALRSNFDAFDATTGRIGALFSYVSTPIWQKRVTYAVGAEALASVEEAFDPVTGDLADQTYFIGALTGQLGYDTSDDLLNPTRGFRLEALVQPEGSLDGGFTPYLRAILDASAYAPVSENVVIAGRARFGTIQGAERVDIAPSRRLYAGGGGSVRGFGFQELGPQAASPNSAFDPDDPEETADPFTFTPIGGRSVIEASAEARYRFGDYGVVAFVDAGQVYQETTPGFDDIRFGVGLGGRIYTSFGPLRVDIATPINRRAGESRLNVYVSIGQAF